MLRISGSCDWLLLLAAGIFLTGCPLDERHLRIATPTFVGGRAVLTVELGTAYIEDSLRIWVGGKLFEGQSERTDNGVVVRVPVASGPTPVRARASFRVPDEDPSQRAHARRIIAPLGAPPLTLSRPAEGAIGVVRSAWLGLEFAAGVVAETQATFELRCDGDVNAFSLHELSSASLVVNPSPELRSGASCELAWQGTEGPETLAFATAGAATPQPIVLYDRTFFHFAQFAPFPDDFWLVPDATLPTGQRVQLPVASRPADVVTLVNAFRPGINQLDGFSPAGGIVIELTDAPDLSSLPMTPDASLDPLASIGLFDLSPGSATFGSRVPFLLTPRSDCFNPNRFCFAVPLSNRNHSLVIYPSISLAPEGRYGLVVTRQAFADPARPFEPSNFTALALSRNQLVGPAVAQARTLMFDVIDTIETAAALPIPAEDVALAIRISIRSMDTLPDSLLAMKQQVLAQSPPAVRFAGCTACPCGARPDFTDVAAIVTGEWEAPNWRSGPLFVARDINDLPAMNGTQNLCFTLALPTAALDGPVPITMYQHGNPGSATFEVPAHAHLSGLAEAGFALAGFTDVTNREFANVRAQILTTFFGFLTNRKWPEFWLTTRGEQLAFVRMLQSLSIDVLPLGDPDGVPDVDPSAPLTYVGISAGAVHGQMLMTYAPEIRAGALVVGGRRFAEDLFHQDTNGVEPLLPTFLALFPNLKPADVWVGLSMVQMLFDPQDGHNHAALLYRNPVEVAGTTAKPSVLVIAGLRDSFVANNGTRALAWTMGPIPHLEPVQEPVSFLVPEEGPIEANIDPTTTSAYVQYDCGLFEGHFCAQNTPASLRQRVIFFETALAEAAPTIVDARIQLP